MEEIYCQQKTKVKWHSDEDGNIAYFHKVAKINNASSLITSMWNGDKILTNLDEVSEHIVNHCTSLLISNTNTQNNSMVEGVIPHSNLTVFPYNMEIFQAIFSLK